MSYSQWFFTGVKVCGNAFEAWYDGTFVGEYATKKAALKAIRAYK